MKTSPRFVQGFVQTVMNFCLVYLHEISALTMRDENIQTENAQVENLHISSP